MRPVLVLLLFAVAASSARAQGALDPESYVALSADDEAQMTLGGFRRYLERIRAGDAALYGALDPRLDSLETRDVAADVVFWTTFGLGAAALVTAIPIATEGIPRAGDSEVLAIGLVAAGLSTLVLGLVVQAVIRPAHGDLVQLIDLHDELAGRR